MTKEEFKTIIDYHQFAQNELEKLENAGINLYEHPVIQSYEVLFDKMMKSVFTEAGTDWLYWWLYEKHGIFNDHNYQAYDKDNKIIPTDTLDELWDNLLYEHRRTEKNEAKD